MKKKFFPVALMALAIGFNACSSDDVTVNANGGDKVSFAEGGYVKMAINMPSEPSGRGPVSDPNSKDNYDQVDFNDGLAGEYEVKNATLILFAGADGESAKFHSAYNLDVSTSKDPSKQITSTTRIVKPVNDNVYGEKAKLYAYVVLNHNGSLKISEDNTQLTLKKDPYNPTSAEVKLKAADPVNNMTFGTFKTQVIEGSVSSFNKDGFLMNNAPLSNKSAVDPTGCETNSLVDISNNVYRTKAAAEAADADEVFVERAVAKVTMQQPVAGALEAKDAVIVDGSGKVNYTVLSWDLDVTNKKSFFGRKYDNSWSQIVNNTKYRFLGSTPLRATPASAAEGSQRYRTYWAEDPNYTTPVDKLDFNRIEKADATTGKVNDGSSINKGFGNDHPLYCMENTFDVAQMAEGSQVTRAIVKVMFYGGKTFYTFNNDNTMLYNKAKKEERIKQAILDNGFFIEQLKADFGAEVSSLTSGKFEFTYYERDKEGIANLKEIKITSPTNVVHTYTKANTGGEELNTKLSLGDIHEYVNGMAYYSIPIKHFGNELTPWDNTTATIGKPYEIPFNETKYLGRYGVLRNNWYDISISAIRNVGSPVVPEIDFTKTNTPDEVKNYIAVRINVLSWAKRTQVEEL